jgi:hypothetical protein
MPVRSLPDLQKVTLQPSSITQALSTATNMSTFFQVDEDPTPTIVSRNSASRGCTTEVVVAVVVVTVVVAEVVEKVVVEVEEEGGEAQIEVVVGG